MKFSMIITTRGVAGGGGFVGGKNFALRFSNEWNKAFDSNHHSYSYSYTVRVEIKWLEMLKKC